MHNISYSKQAEIDLEDAIGHIAKRSKKCNSIFIIRIYHSSVDYANKFNKEIM